MKSIALFLSNPGLGGTETFAASLVLHLRQLGREASIYNCTESPTRFDNYCKMLGIEESWVASKASVLGLQRTIRKILCRDRPDVVVTLGFRCSIASRFAIYSRSSAPVTVCCLRGRDDWKKWYHVALDRASQSVVDWFVGVSDDVCELRKVREKTPACKIVSIPNGIDLSRFSRASEEISARSALGLPNGPLCVVVGNFRREKGHDFLVDVVAKLKSLDVGVSVALVGEGSGRSEIESRAAEAGVSDRLFFMGYRSDIRQILSVSDLFVLPSRTEGMPRALMEAMAMRVPVVSTLVGGVRQLISNGVTGRSVEFGDVIGMARAIRDSFEYTEEGKSMVESAFLLIKNQYSMECIVNRYLDLFETRAK